MINRWLSENKKGWSAVSFSLKAYGFLLVWAVLTGILLSLALPEEAAERGVELDPLIMLGAESLAVMVPLVVLLAGAEEVFFRLIPLWLLIKAKVSELQALCVIVLVSVIFGLLHGGAAFILIQGVGGLVFFAVMIKCAGPTLRRGFAYAWTVHAAFNLTLLIPTALLLRSGPIPA